MPHDQPGDTDTPIVAKIRWGRVSASIPIHLVYFLWPILEDGALMFGGRETDPLFVVLPLAALAFGLLGWGVGPAITAWWTKDADRFASLVPIVRQMQQSLRTSERLTAEAGGGERLYRATDVDNTGEAVAKLEALGVYFGKYAAPTPRDFGQLVDHMERCDLKAARKRWPEIPDPNGGGGTPAAA